MRQEREQIQVEELHKEIDLIQNCINRMSNNSFLLKGWLITIIAAVVTLSQKDLNIVVFFVLFFSTLIFWGLDAFFLRTEKEYREMYEWMLEKRRQNSRELQYDLNPKRFDSQVGSIFCIMRSPVLAGFYLYILITVILVTLYLSCPIGDCLTKFFSCIK